jgi:hypothetical protein
MVIKVYFRISQMQVDLLRSIGYHEQYSNCFPLKKDKVIQILLHKSLY